MRRLIAFFLIAPSFLSSILYAQVSKNELANKGVKDKGSKSNSKELIWRHLSDPSDAFNNQIIWQKIEDKVPFDLKRDNKKKAEKIGLYNQQIDLDLLELGRSVPNARTLNKGDLRIKFTQIAPFKKAYYGGGTGNQNYEASFNYGVNDSFMIEGFYSHSDDPLQKKITKYDDPVSNRWIIYGTSFTWQFINKNDLLMAFNSSIENWNVKSGGCNTYNCDKTSNNIFTNQKEEIINNNLVGSISLPINYKLTNRLDFNLSPRYIFLPLSQSKESSSGKFYGSSFGVGTGIEYKLLKNLKSYSSFYFPIASGYNSFDENLIFKKKAIYNAGIIYSLDPKIFLEAAVTNGFGLSPSIGTLTLPSSDEILYKTSLIYRPKNINLPSKNKSKNNRLRYGGLSVSTAEPLNPGEIYVNYYLNNNSSSANKFAWGASNRFNFDITFSSIGQNEYTDKPFAGKYHSLNKLFVRGGGKAVFLSQMNGDFITSAARVSAGRLRGQGWLLTELINTYKLNDDLSLNLNPKVSFSGIASPASFGTSLNWQIHKDISLIPEYNIALKESTDNWTIALRFSKFRNINFDLFTTSSLNFIDTGQMQRSESNSYGFNVGFMF